jgi:hypothetical protein
MKAIHENRPKAPKFANSLYFDFQKKGFVDDRDEVNGDNDQWGTTVYISKLIFQAVEDVISTWGTIDKSSLSEWIATFVQWLHGKEMQRMWSVHKYSYNQMTTVPLVNYIIKTINANKIKTGEDLVIISNKLSQDQNIVEILNKGLE